MDTLRSNEQRLPRHSENLIDSAFQSKLNIKANYSDKESSGGDQNKEVPFRGSRNFRGRGRYSRDRWRNNFTRRSSGENI